MSSKDAGERALDHLDKALAAKPQKDGHALSATLRCLAELRNGLVAEQRNQPPDLGPSRRIEHVNGVISSVLAAQFPLGEVPWDELAKARQWLADLVDACALADGRGSR